MINQSEALFMGNGVTHQQQVNNLIYNSESPLSKILDLSNTTSSIIFSGGNNESLDKLDQNSPLTNQIFRN